MRAASDGKLAAAAVGGAAFVVGAYANSLRNGFHFDDSHVIERNLAIRSLRNVPRFFTDARTFSILPANQTYRPIASTWLALDYWIGGGLNSVAFHAAQIALLLATGVALFMVYDRLFTNAVVLTTAPSDATTWPRYAAVAAATLFCVHSANTETLNFISCCSELLSGLGLLGAFLVYLHVPASRRLHLYLAPMLLGMLAKTPAVVFAPLLLAYRLLIEEQLSLSQCFRREHRSTVVAAVRAALPDFVIGVVAYVLIERMNPPGQSYGGGSRMLYLATESWVWLRYLRLFVLPIGLTADSDLSPFTHLADARVFAGLAVAAVTVLWMLRSARRRESRPIAFGIVWFWLGVLPSSSVFPLAEVTNDHRMFSPFMGLVAAAVWQACVIARGIASRSGRPTAMRAVAAAGVVVIVAHGVATRARNGVWANDETLWASVVAESPGNARGWMNYGLAQMRTGRYDLALANFQHARLMAPNYNYLEINTAVATDATGDSVSAFAHFQRALALDSNYAGAHYFFGRWLAHHGAGDSAITHLRRALAISPNDADTRHLLLSLVAARSDSAGLLTLAVESLALDPSDTIANAWVSGRIPLRPDSAGPRGWFLTGARLAGAGEHADAVAAYRAALAGDPRDADIWNDLGWSLDRLGFFDSAAIAYGQAISLRPTFERARNNRAALDRRTANGEFRRAFALQQAGHPGEAVPIYRGLLERFPNWANAHFNLGHAWLSLGQCADADREFARAVSLQASFAEARAMIGKCARLPEDVVR